MGKRKRNYAFRKMKFNKNKFNSKFFFLILFIMFLIFIIISEFNVGDDKKFIKDFFKTYGWELEANPETHKEVYIPKKFDKDDENYNILQKDINSNLEKYKGRKAELYIYRIANRYLFFNGKKVALNTEVMVLDNKVIAGSIYSDEAKKFQMSLKNRTVEEIKNEK